MRRRNDLLRSLHSSTGGDGRLPSAHPLGHRGGHARAASAGQDVECGEPLGYPHDAAAGRGHRPLGNIGKNITPSSETPDTGTSPAVPDWLVQVLTAVLTRAEADPYRGTGPADLARLHPAHPSRDPRRRKYHGGCGARHTPGRSRATGPLRLQRVGGRVGRRPIPKGRAAPFRRAAAAGILGRLRGDVVVDRPRAAARPDRVSSVRSQSATVRRSPRLTQLRPSPTSRSQPQKSSSDVYINHRRKLSRTGDQFDNYR